MGGPDDSQSMGNRFLGDAGDIPGINLPDRVDLVAELGHFVGGLPSNPDEAGIAPHVDVFSMYFQWISLLFVRPERTSPASAGFEGSPPTK